MPEFKMGDKVQWTMRSFSGRTRTYITKNATVVGMHDKIPNVVLCKYRNGKPVAVHATRLRMQGERSELTDAFLNTEERKN